MNKFLAALTMVFVLALTGELSSQTTQSCSDCPLVGIVEMNLELTPEDPEYWEGQHALDGRSLIEDGMQVIIRNDSVLWIPATSSNICEVVRATSIRLGLELETPNNVSNSKYQKPEEGGEFVEPPNYGEAPKYSKPFKGLKPFGSTLEKVKLFPVGSTYIIHGDSVVNNDNRSYATQAIADCCVDSTFKKIFVALNSNQTVKSWRRTAYEEGNPVYVDVKIGGEFSLPRNNDISLGFRIGTENLFLDEDYVRILRADAFVRFQRKNVELKTQVGFGQVYDMSEDYYGIEGPEMREKYIIPEIAIATSFGRNDQWILRADLDARIPVSGGPAFMNASLGMGWKPTPKSVISAEVVNGGIISINGLGICNKAKVSLEHFMCLGDQSFGVNASVATDLRLGYTSWDFGFLVPIGKNKNSNILNYRK